MKKALLKALKIIEAQNYALLQQLYLYQNQDTEVIDLGHYPTEDDMIDKYCVESDTVH